MTDSSSNKVCSRCGVEKALAEFHGAGTAQPCKVCRAAWYQEHRLEAIAAEHNRKARRLNIPGTLSADDLAEVLAEQGVACIVPGCYETANLHFDHVFSFYARGENTRDNLQILCRGHNSAKGRNCIDYRD